MVLFPFANSLIAWHLAPLQREFRTRQASDFPLCIARLTHRCDAPGQDALWGMDQPLKLAHSTSRSQLHPFLGHFYNSSQKVRNCCLTTTRYYLPNILSSGTGTAALTRTVTVVDNRHNGHANEFVVGAFTSPASRATSRLGGTGLASEAHGL